MTEHSRIHGTAESYFTSLVRQLDGDPKQAALRPGLKSEYKLPAFSVVFAAEALKNLGFDVARPDRHVVRAVASFGLVLFRSRLERDGRAAPPLSSRSSYLAVMRAVQEIAMSAGMPVVLVDNAIRLLAVKSGFYMTNPELSDLAHDSEAPKGRAEAVGALIRSWIDMNDGGEQRETADCLVEGLDKERLSMRKLFPEELKGRSW